MGAGAEQVIRDSRGRSKLIVTIGCKPDPERHLCALLMLSGVAESEARDIIERRRREAEQKDTDQ